MAVPKLCLMTRSLVPPCASGLDPLLFPAPWLQVSKGQRFSKTITRSMEVFEEQGLMKAMTIAALVSKEEIKSPRKRTVAQLASLHCMRTGAALKKMSTGKPVTVVIGERKGKVTAKRAKSGKRFSRNAAVL